MAKEKISISLDPGLLELARKVAESRNDGGGVSGLIEEQLREGLARLHSSEDSAAVSRVEWLKYERFRILEGIARASKQGDCDMIEEGVFRLREVDEALERADYEEAVAGDDGKVAAEEVARLEKIAKDEGA